MGVAVKVTGVLMHIVDPADDTIDTDGVVSGFTVIVIPPLVAVGTEAHAALLVITQVTTSVLFSALLI